MDVQLSTYAIPVLDEVRAGHTDCTKLPIAAAFMLRDRMGKPYHSTSSHSRWAGVFAVDVLGCLVRAPFELVICTRGASVRGRWKDMPLIEEIIGRMAPIEAISVTAH